MYIWLIIIIILGIIEMLSLNLVTIWYIASGVIALLVSLIIDSFTIQFATFVIFGTILLITTRKKLTNLIKKDEKTNLDRIIGTKALVTEEITENTIGEVKADGKRWSAISKENLKVGSIVKILKINGVKLEVESWEE